MDSCKSCVYWERGKISTADGFGICKNTNMFLKTKNLKTVKDKNVVLMANSGDSTFLTGEAFCCKNFRGKKIKRLVASPQKENKIDFNKRAISERARKFYPSGGLDVNANKGQDIEVKNVSKNVRRITTPKKVEQVNRETKSFERISIEDAFSKVFKEEEEKRKPKRVSIGQKVHAGVVKSSSTILRGTYKKVVDEKTGEKYLVTVIGGKAVSRKTQGYLNLGFYLGAFAVFGAVGYIIFFIITSIF